MEAVHGVLWTNTADGRMEGPQPGWQALTGQTPEEYTGYGWSNAVHPDDAQPTVVAWEAAVAARSIFVFEHRVRRHDGAWRNCLIRGLPIKDAEGTIVEWVGVAYRPARRARVRPAGKRLLVARVDRPVRARPV